MNAQEFIDGGHPHSAMRLGILSIPSHMVCTLMGLGDPEPAKLAKVYGIAPDAESIAPSEFHIVSHEFDFESQCYRIIVEHRSLPLVVQGMKIPVLSAEYHAAEYQEQLN